ncbi:MAG: response regulator [Candidatus Scalindua sp.]|nr:response regulator [Candidatus Scalindua sp.]MDV5166706.1 response regulator [Candidatus Scalindua sp.]
MKTNRRILVVDDNIDYCEGIIDFLEMEGFDAKGVHDGFKALETIEEEEFDMVLMDVRMPGVETFQKLKKISPDTPTILMTAFAVESRIREALRNGVFGAFQKPVNNERLICSIKKSFPGGAVIMIADDDKELCSYLLDRFAEKGYREIVDRNQESAVLRASEKNFDFIILNANQKDIDGVEAYQKIRDFRPDVNIIIITDNKKETENLIDQTENKDICTIFEKPLDLDSLIETVQNTFEGRN